MRRLVGLVGYARAGKDSAASALTRHRSYQRVAFADPLSAILLGLDPLVEVPPAFGNRYGAPVVRYSELLERVGYERAKEFPEVRRLLQRIGGGHRRLFGPDYWVEIGRAKWRRLERAVVTDVRYQNEADAIRADGGVIALVTRPGVGPVNGHDSERLPAAIAPDFHLDNDGPIEELWLQALSIDTVLEYAKPREE